MFVIRSSSGGFIKSFAGGRSEIVKSLKNNTPIRFSSLVGQFPLCRRFRDKQPNSRTESPIKNLLSRNYHATRPKEILPLIGVAAVAFIGRYSYKALQRMDAEWEEYQWELAQYEKQLARTGQSTEPIKTIAIDLGSIYAKLATSFPRPEIIVSPQGDRFIFNGIQYEPLPDQGDNVMHMVRGTKALERFYYGESECPVQLPWNALASSSTNVTLLKEGHEIVADVLDPALMEALERLDYKADDPESTPFRSVAVVPPQYQQSYQKALEGIAATCIPEPVAAVWGAQHVASTSTKGSKLSMIPPPDSKTGHTVLVVDVGGLVTQLSLVQKDRVLAATSLPWGGERWIQLLGEQLLSQSGSSIQDARSLASIYQHARTAAAELSTKTRVDIHVPYLFADPKNHHLEATMSRNVLEQTIQDDISKNLTEKWTRESSAFLSPHMSLPTDLTSLWISCIAQVLELSQKMPTDLDYVLLVGGASRAPIVSKSLEGAILALTAQSKLIVPDNSLAPELTVLGASTLLPAYDYSAEQGLHRVDM